MHVIDSSIAAGYLVMFSWGCITRCLTMAISELDLQKQLKGNYCLKIYDATILYMAIHACKN